MSVGTIIGGGFRLVRTQPRIVAIWAAIYLAASTAGMLVMRPWSAAMMAFQQQAAANAAAGVRTPPPFPAQWVGTLLLLELLFLLALVVAFAAVVRAVARSTSDRFAYLRLGMDELRLIGLGAILGIATAVAEFVAILVVALAAVLVTVVAGQAAAVVVAAVLVIALVGGLIFVQVRLSLAGALTVMRGRIVIRDAWRLTRGQFWTLFGVFALLAVGVAVVGIAVLALTNPAILAAYARFDAQAVTAAAQQQIRSQGAGISAGMIAQLVLGSIVGVLTGVIGCGAVATAALELSAPDLGQRRAD